MELPLSRTLTLGIVIVAPKIRVDEDCPKVTFLARQNNILRIGSAVGKGSPSESYSPFMEGFSTLGGGSHGSPVSYRKNHRLQSIGTKRGILHPQSWDIYCCLGRYPHCAFQ